MDQIVHDRIAWIVELALIVHVREDGREWNVVVVGQVDDLLRYDGWLGIGYEF